MTEKVLNFTEEEKSLIWSTKIAPTNGTPEDAKAFVLVCEEYGLNPLQGDIVFQRYETKYGPKVSYLITRDGLLKHANRQKDFVSINAGVVKKNDVFEFDVNNETVVHKFGTERGEVIGAWAVLKTKTKGNLLEFADYKEYKQALGGKNALWNTMPSAMIKKVAQSNVIKTAFPLGVVFEVEEDVIEYDLPTSTQESNTTDSSAEPTLIEELKAEAEKTKGKKEDKSKTTESKRQDKSTVTQSVEDNKVLVKQSDKKEQKEEIKSETQEVTTENQSKTESVEPIHPQEEVQAETTESLTTQVQDEVETVQESTVQSEDVTDIAFTFVESQLSVSPTTQKPFLRVKAEKQGNLETLFAAEAVIEAFDEFTKGIRFEADIQEEQGFKFVKGVNVVA